MAGERHAPGSQGGDQGAAGEFAADPERLARFEQEARAAAALNHPHIAVVYDIGAADGVHFIVQELLQGKPLHEALREGKLPVDRALALGTEIAEALAAAHAVGVVHRDLKPANLFVSPHGHAKVLDFGLAKLTEAGPGGMSEQDRSKSPTILGTVAGQVMGTAGYMAPEQVEGGEIDGRADIFGFGCVLYEMVTGQRPFAGRSVMQTLDLIVHESPPSLRDIDAKLPAQLQWILDKCLAKDRARRYQHADDLAVDLRQLAGDVEAGAAQNAPAEPVALAPTRAGMPLPLVAGLMLAVALAAALVGGMLRPAAEPPPLRTFEVAFPEAYPNAMPCCSTSLRLDRAGKRLAFFATADLAAGIDSAALFVRRLDSLEIEPVPGVSGYMPAFSPDGEWIVYAAFEGNRATGLKKVALAGGAPFDLGEQLGMPFWASDGYIYYGSLGSSVGGSRVPENGGDPESLEFSGVPEGSRILRMTVLGEQRVALLDLAARQSMVTTGIAVARLDDLQARILIEEGSDARWSPSGHLLWQRAGVVYAAPFDPGSMQLTGRAVPVLQGVAVDFTGGAQFDLADDGTLAWIPGAVSAAFDQSGQLGWLAADGSSELVVERKARFGTPRLSPDERRIATVIREEDSTDVWILDIAQDALTRLTSGGGAAPLWSPDGEWVYFSTTPSGGDIWRRRTDFSGPAEPVLEREGDQRVSSIAPDGRTLVYVEQRAAADGESTRRDDLWVLPLDGGEPTPLVESDDSEYSPEYSPDGRLLAYVSNESGIPQVYVREVQGQRRWTASSVASATPRWSRDGRQLHWQAGSEIQTVDVAFDGEYRQSPVRVTRRPEFSFFGLPDVGSDGRFLVVLMDNPLAGAPGARAKIVVTLNWAQELERLAPHGR